MPLPNGRFRLRSYQHNGQWLFVSNDMEGPDHVLEGHPFPDEFRDQFEAHPDGNGGVRLFNPATDCYVFVSNDVRAGDRVVEAHPFEHEPRNSLFPNQQSEGSWTFWSADAQGFLFLSNDQKGGDYVIESHPPDEVRNRFFTEPV
ncbi:hypothetical protein QFZ63_004366 [Streptomyces sp. B3I7]|uniref:hypothetical protein n=1 Tax=Streptomyces sp. B3I7 TaxID=3042269 RepID=UPI00278606A5|nr:hypothetical protein [Streptomyces sp. B3I7]MDQ0812652.1 hypothetical protein [Streptomyces sp. B3I7]